MSTLPAIHPLAPAPPDAEAGGVNLLRIVTWGGDVATPLDHVCRVSIPQELWLWPDVPMGWGGDPREGVTLALNVLDRWFPAEDQDMVAVWHRPLACSQEAYALCWTYWREVLRLVPFWGGHVAASLTRAWMAGLLRGPYPRAGWPHLTQPHDVWPAA